MGGGHLLLFVPRVSALDAVGAVGHRHRVDGRALLAGGMGRVRQAGARLAGVVVKLHQAEDEVRGHQLEPVRGIGDDIPVGEGGWRRCVRGLQNTRDRFDWADATSRRTHRFVHWL